ncbi:uncharacterized protein B0I36DRAFT_368835 [Microdochium trichocladiopsis]|uniref:Aminoglycoside phosphotransferase domain-containing protein n=1 Tax=Microdochium trichocladiopsis TaxID=1682393 RepID=A0A9P8XV85_9PEZI|nr:uncharacterized protein B0I36DRAFT_368835 [Microdochium trichocladiopsis]KAH7016272.1 hypothetical protein B0I36DRAFT_368835 [Microdochium trichocladiopsis]
MASCSHVRDSVRQIDNTTWLIGTSHVLRLEQGPGNSGSLWENSSDGSSYDLSRAPEPLPNARPIPDNSHVRQIHDAGDASAVFAFGDALILKIRLATHGTRQEPETLALLAGKTLSFDIPKVLFYAEEAGKTYLLEPLIPGKRLDDIWWDMTEDQKEGVVTRISQVCSELRAFQSDSLTVLDDGWLEPFQEKRSSEVQALQKHCESLGMDCSVFFLSHNDLGPTNILVTETETEIAILDWELAGFSPLEWVRTKFAVCGALDMENQQKAKNVSHGPGYRVRIEQRLGDLGFPEATEAYKAMRTERYEEWKKPRPWLQ